MQPARRRGRKRFPADYLAPILVVIAVIVIIFFLSKSSSDRDEGAVEVLLKSDELESMPKVEYELVLSEGPTDKPDILRYRAIERLRDGSFVPISVHRWTALMKHKSLQYAGDMAYFFNDVFKTAEMDAFFLETKGVTYKNSHQKVFEFALVRNQELYDNASKQDVAAFSDKLDCGATYSFVCVFPGVEPDSVIVAPKKKADGDNVYGHLAAFARRAPITQIMTFWREVMETYLSKLESKKDQSLWLSTHGSGVAWMHVRLDPKPKDYEYQAFADEKR